MTSTIKTNEADARLLIRYTFFSSEDLREVLDI